MGLSRRSAFPLLLGLLVAGCGERDEAAATPRTPPAEDRSPPPAIASAPVVVDARPLAGRPELDVRAALGTPTACEVVAKGRRCRYAHGGGTEVVYIDGTADWIRIDDLGGAPFAPAALARVGLPTDEEPIERTPDFIRWQNLDGFREVTLHAGPGGRAAYVEMKTSTL